MSSCHYAAMTVQAVTDATYVAADDQRCTKPLNRQKLPNSKPLIDTASLAMCWRFLMQVIA